MRIDPLPDLRQWPDFVLPDQIAVSRVERLHGVARVDEYSVPLCTSGIGWFAPPFSLIAHTHASLQILDVGARDLVERAVAPAPDSSVAPMSQSPGGGFFEHLVGHRA